jgi:hypothetical protein
MPYTSNYRSTVAVRIARAARLARARGLQVEVQTPFMNLRRKGAWACIIFRSDHIVLERIQADETARFKRGGSDLLADIIAIGDGLHLRIDLIVECGVHSGEPGLNQRNLKGWYGRHEFVAADDVLMRRNPRPASRSPLQGARQA